MSYELKEQQIAQQMIARNLPGLFELLLNLKGLNLNQRYTLRWLYAVGGQSILYLADSPNGQMALVKMVLLPYHRAAYVSNEEIRRARQRLEEEARLLRRFRGTVLPEFYDLVYAPNPLHTPARGDEIANQEPYLVMEFIQGRNLLEVARKVHRSGQPDYHALEWLAWQVAITVCDFSITISEQEDGCLYSDFNPLNAILTDHLDKPVRILDAGSLIPVQPQPSVSPPFTWAYIPPEYYEAYDKGKLLWPTPGYVMYTLGKTLWEILTNRQPYPAENPDLSEPTLKNYSHHLRTLITSLVERQYYSFQQLKKAIEFMPVSRQLPKSKLAMLLTAPQPAPTESAPMRVIPPSRPTAAVTTMQLIEVHGTQVNAVQVLRYSPSGKYIAVASQNRVELWDARTLCQIRRFNSPHRSSVLSLDFDATGRYLASGSTDGTICLWNIDASDAVWQFQPPNKIFTGLVALDARGELLAAATVWDAVVFRPQFAIRTEHRFAGIVDKCTCIALAKQRSLLVVGGLRGLRIWNLQTNSELQSLRLDQGAVVWQVAVNSGNTRLAALASDIQSPSRCFIVVWDMASYQPVHQVEVPGKQVGCIALEPNGHFVAAGSDNHLWVWNLVQQTEYVRLSIPGTISTLDFSPDGQAIAVGTFAGRLQVYTIEM